MGYLIIIHARTLILFCLFSYSNSFIRNAGTSFRIRSCLKISSDLDLPISNDNNLLNKSKIFIPKTFTSLNHYTQLSITILFFWFHTVYLSQKVLVLPYELSPTPLTSIGYDTLFGLLCLLGVGTYHSKNHIELPSLLFADRVPWRRPQQHPIRSFLLILLIFIMYYSTSHFSPMITQLLDELSTVFAVSVPLQRNLGVVIAHLIWVLPSSLFTSSIQHFLDTPLVEGINTNDNNQNTRKGSHMTGTDSMLANEQRVANETEPYGGSVLSLRELTFTEERVTDTDTDIKPAPAPAPVIRYGRRETRSFWKPHRLGGSDWMTLRIRQSNWVWWVIGGYSVSVLLFRVSDWFNLMIPEHWVNEQHIVNQMIRPEGHDLWALAVGALAPCVTAPWWEEIFYRGLIFPWLSSILPMPLATPLSALVFAAHHGRLDAMIPLTVLGLTWALLYLLSGNLFVTILVHAMWNSRVFIGSLIGK